MCPPDGTQTCSAIATTMVEKILDIRSETIRFRLAWFIRVLAAHLYLMLAPHAKAKHELVIAVDYSPRSEKIS